MFDDLVAAAAGTRGNAAVAAWARVENAACARRLAAMAAELARQCTGVDAAEREQWCLDNWDQVCAAIGAAQNVSLGVASHQLLVAQDLHERLPRVAAVFASGAITYRMVAAVVARTRLVTDAAVMAELDTDLAAQISGWGPLSVAKTEAAIDSWVERHDPAALRRTESRARRRHLDIAAHGEGSGLASLDGVLFGHDAQALDQRLEAMARAVCPDDPRTLDQRRSDALGALGHGADRLRCGCGADDCPTADAQPSAVLVHIIAEAEALTDESDAHLDGPPSPPPSPEPSRPPTPPPTPTANPAWLMGGAMLPAALLAAKIAAGARIEPVIHPGQAPPEPRYIPSKGLSRFVRCRDLTCRFPGCDEPAQRCDLDHTIAYPNGPTQASNLKALCRKHHLLKTFGGWRDEQRPDGAVVWTAPDGNSYTTHPGSRLLFPSLCRPTAPAAQHVALDHPAPGRTMAMPRRTRTRTQNRARAIAAERRLNDDHVAYRNKPPPF